MAKELQKLMLSNCQEITAFLPLTAISQVHLKLYSTSKNCPVSNPTKDISKASQDTIYL